MRWPSSNRQGVFQYLAITDSCGNARVQPFRTQFEVPVKPMPSGQCGGGNKGVLRIFSEGGQVRVTAFNLDRPTTSTVVSETYVVPVPALQDWVSARPPRSLFNDPRIDDIIIDCAPPKAPGSLKRFIKAKRRPGGPPAAGGAKTKDGKKLKRVRRATVRTAQSTSGYPLAHQSLVIGPEPLAQGNCRLEWRGKSKNRLAVPLALRVSLQRTDKAVTKPLVEETWVVTPSTGVFRLPQLQGKAEFDGESRYRLEVHTLPNSPHGRAILVSDVATALSNGQATGAPTDVGKLVGSVTIHSAPLCGDSNLELPRNVGSCFRFYFTVPAMLATLQLTRAPWLENPIVTREVLSSVGVAFAVDRYDPVERKAFPLALQLGGFVQKIGESTALTPYVGLAPTIPFLGDGGNTTTIGLLGGLGMAYLTNTTGPDEGFKPTAFLSVVVQVGQVSPTGGSEKSSFGSMP